MVLNLITEKKDAYIGLPGLGLATCTQSTPNPGAGNCNENNLGQYIPVAVPDTLSYPNSDYYVIGVGQYRRQLHSDLPSGVNATWLRGYYQINTTDPAIQNVNQYLGPAVIGRTYRPDMPVGVQPITGYVNGKPVRLQVQNHLPLSPGDTLFLPVDPTIMGAGMGPLDSLSAVCDYGTGAFCASYTQNRATIHLHGGNTPWISDGTPHQWTTPAGDLTPFQKGMSFWNVPDMVTGASAPLINGVAVPCIGGAACVNNPGPGDGISTHFYTNQQSARLMFYHDHAYGITRLNVYAGLGAPYLLVDQVEDDLIDATNKSGLFGASAPVQVLPNLGGCSATSFSSSPGPCAYRYGIPLVIQDKSFVNDTTTDGLRSGTFPSTHYVPTDHTLNTDPLWYGPTTAGGFTNPGVNTPGGNLWFPHEYMPIENVFDPSGNTPNGRWDYAPFMIPPMMPLNLTLPSPALVPKSFLDTAVVNGTPFPFLNLPADAVRFRILSVGNDRSFNLQLYSAAVAPALVTFGTGCATNPIASTSVSKGVVTGITLLSPGSGCTSTPSVTISDVSTGTGSGATAHATADLTNSVVTGLTLDTGGSGYLAGTVCKTPLPAWVTPLYANTSALQPLCTEVAMVPAAPNPGFPTWPQDGRDGGVPDPMTQGPPWIQIGNEGGLLANVAVWPQQPVDYEYNRQNIVLAGVTSRTLFLMPAMRADIIVDLSSYNIGDTFIVYNDAPAPAPNYWTINDYYTDDPDQRSVGAAPPTPPGFGPNTRTLMQIRIASAKTSALNFYSSATPGFDRKSPIGSFLPPKPGPTPDGATLAALKTWLPKAFAASQDKPLVPQCAYNAAFPGFAPQPPPACDTFAQNYTETLNLTGAAQPVARIMTTAPGNNYTVAPIVNIVSSPTNCSVQPAATAGINPAGGITLLTAGAGYTSVPTVTIGAPNGGGTGSVQATAVATISGSVVSAISIVEPGANYSTTTAPTCAITGGGATTAATCSVFVATANTVGSITITNPGSCLSQPEIFLTNVAGVNGVGASAAALLQGALIMTGKNLTEGFDPDYGRMDIRLGSTPNPLTPNVGNGFVVGIERYIDPPNEILNNGEKILWRLTHLGVDSHAMHFHLFNLQVVNRVDWTNVVKPPYFDEQGWRETIRTNPMEDIIVAIQPKTMVLPFPLPTSSRPLDVTTPLASTTNFLPVAPPAGIAAVPQISNLTTNFGFEYVWHCHLLGHEENDMMRPMVLQITPVPMASAPAVAWNPTLGKYHVAIRRADNRIYVGTATIDGVVDNDFVQIPSGSTGLSPAIAWNPNNNKIQLAVRGLNNTNIYLGNMNADGTGFSGWKVISVTSGYSPAIAWNATTNKLQMAVVGPAPNNRIYVATANYDGTGVSGWTQFTSGSSLAAPALAWNSTTGKIQLAVRGSTANRVYVSNANADGTAFSGWVALPTAGLTTVAPAITWNATTSKVEVTIMSTGNTIYKAAVNGDNTGITATLPVFTQVAGAVSTDSPAVGIDPLLSPLNVFARNASSNIAGYVTTP